MELSAEWRTRGAKNDAILVLDAEGSIREAIVADDAILSRFLTEQLADLDSWRGQTLVEGANREPEAWGELVISRAGSGEVIEADPELFWQGIYLWFRSHGVDYDTPMKRSNSLIED